jgi:ATP-binding cassette subfamily F protein 3
LLDEPTNHLDIESIQWLERYLKSYAGIILLISHDKQFLDNITNRTIELANGKLYDYKSNYSKYLQLREEEIITQIAAKKNQEKMVKHTQELINKFRAKKNKAAFAQSLIKKLDKLEDIEIDQLEKDRIQFQFPEPSHSGKETLKIAGLEKSYGDKQIFKKVDLSIARGEKIALIGKNGMGKSTFIKSIVKDIEFSGNVQLGHQVMMGYFAQDEAHKLDPKKTVFETIDDVAVGEVRKQIRPILGSFLFSGEDIDKKVQVLSGGEKTRLSLCKLLLQPNNFLILDEPTNHLDMASKEILKDALNSYSGTLLLVSHDRGFLDGLTDRVYFIKDQSIKVYHEPVTQFIESYYGNIDEKTVSKKVEVKSTQNKKFQNQQKSIERKITNLEEKQTGLEFELYETSDADRIKNIQDQLSKIKSEIDKNFELLMSIGN